MKDAKENMLWLCCVEKADYQRFSGIFCGFTYADEYELIRIKMFRLRKKARPV